LAVIIGGIIGLGILRTPGEVAAAVPDPMMFVSLWVLSGLFILLSTIVVAELVGMTPRSGGTYALVRCAYGPFPGFVIGWVDWLTFVADIAFKAVVVTEFAALLIPATGQWKTPLAIMVSSVFAALQLRSIALGAKIQQIAAAALALIVVGFTLALVFAESAVSSSTTSVPHTANGLGAWSLVIASIIYTYDGWYYAAYFSGEIKGGGKAVARACIKGTVIVILLYVFLVAALAWKVPLTSLAGNELALAGALEMVVSPLPEPAVHGHAPNSPGTGGRWPGRQARRGNLKRWQSDLCGAAVLGAFGHPDHDRRIRFSAAPFRIFLPVLICSADRGSHHPAFAPAGR
jgi:APA family basic amino acid/polyamine antiporter